MTGLLRHNQGVDEPTKRSLSQPADPQEVLFAPASNADFPDALRRIARPVAALWYRGRLPDSTSHRRLLAIVGARAASRVGCRRTEELAATASKHGHTIVSGGALGIDAAAHRGALDAGAPTFAVLGCGVDVVYPDRHTGLFAEIVVSGGLLSEFPPGTPPRGRQFPSRNRIVTALAQAVVVVEAQARSGALVTARIATAMGRPLFAVPGSAGTDALIASGKARPVGDGAELLAALAGEAQPARLIPPPLLPLVRALAGGASAVEVARRLNLSLPAALALLSEAELGGWILKGFGGVFTPTEVTRAN